MTYRLVFHASAREDVIDASAWYESQQPGLSLAYLESVENCLSQIAAYPLINSELSNQVRRASIKRFPDWVYYLLDRDRIVILAVLHARRNPSVWKGRVE